MSAHAARHKSTKKEDRSVNRNDVEEEMVTTVDCGVPPIAGHVNLYDGGTPYVPVAVHDIEKYFTESGWRSCVRTIRTIGIVRVVGEDYYELESVNEIEGAVRVPLSRGTSRELKRSRNLTLALAKRAEANAKKKKNPKKKAEHPDEAASAAKKELPFPSTFQDPTSATHARVMAGVAYIVLGSLRWANSKPLLDVDKFMRIRNLSSTYELFLLHTRMARGHVECYHAHPGEIKEFVKITRTKGKSRNK